MPKEDPFVNRAQLLKAIKKYPEIWDSNNKLHMCRSVTAPMWNEIAEQFGGHVPTVKLQSIWSQMKYHYHNLVHRQILHKERFTTKWEHFEPMSFMYNITVSKIIGSTTTSNNSNHNTSTNSNNNNNNNNNNYNNNSNNNNNNKTSLQSSICPQTSVVVTQGRGRPSGTFTWLTQPPSPPNVFCTTSALSAAVTTTTTTTAAAAATISPPSMELNIDANAFSGLSSLVVPADIVNVETVTTTIRKPGRPGSMHSGLRGRIIDAIKMHPAIWGSRQRDQQRHSQCQNRTSKIWKEIATQLGLTPTLIQTRWAIIKQRYVDELQKERYAHYSRQGFHSTWEHFERMSFMRDILIKKVDEREQTREHIQEIVNEQQHQQQQQQLQHLQLHHHHHQHNHEQLQNIRFGIGAVGLGRATGLHSHATLTSSALSSLELCTDGSDTICDAAGNAFIGMTAMSSLEAVTPTLHMIGAGSGGVCGNRRTRTATVKTETDLEWDPFEMILHVHGSDPSSPTNN